MNIVIHPTSFVEEGAEVGEGTKIGPYCFIRKGAKVGKNCSFSSFCEIREGVEVGDNCSFGCRCTISAGAKIGSNNLIKGGFILTDTPNLEKKNYKDVGNVGSGVLIGVSVILMPGFNIGDNSVIGACSQIRCNIPPNEIWFGSPAKFFKKRER